MIDIAHAAAESTNVASETGNQIASLIGYIINQIPLWITGIIVLVVSFIIARLVKSSVENKLATEGFEEEHKGITILAGRTANAAVLIIGITVALKIAGIDITAIVAAGAFGLGFALQDIIMNFISGVMILASRHYSIGDVIKVDGTMGKIVEIQTRATILKAFDGTKIIVPNATLFSNQVTSYTSNPYRRIQLVNGVGYGADLKKTMQVVMDAVKSTPGVLVKPKPSLFFYEWGDYSINFKVNAWVETKTGWVKIRNLLIMNIGKALDESGIDIPYPIQTIYMDKEEADSEKELEKAVNETLADRDKEAAQTNVPQWLANTTTSQPASAPVIQQAALQPTPAVEVQPVVQLPAESAQTNTQPQ